MRVTTQMIDESARRAGIPVNRTSLLDYINSSGSGNTLLDALNKNGSSGNTLLDALNKSGSMVDTVSKSTYAKLGKAADQLWKAAEAFTAEGKDSIFAKAKESGSNEEIYAGVESLVKSYNDTAKALKTASNPLNDFYRQMLKEAASENREALENIGITISKDGTAVLNRDKLKAADMDTLEKVLGASGGFSEKMAFLGTRISDNAEANTANLSSLYGATGNVYSALSNKYDFWG